MNNYKGQRKKQKGFEAISNQFIDELSQLIVDAFEEENTEKLLEQVYKKFSKKQPKSLFLAAQTATEKLMKSGLQDVKAILKIFEETNEMHSEKGIKLNDSLKKVELIEEIILKPLEKIQKRQ